MTSLILIQVFLNEHLVVDVISKCFHTQLCPEIVDADPVA